MAAPQLKRREISIRHTSKLTGSLSNINIPGPEAVSFGARFSLRPVQLASLGRDEGLVWGLWPGVLSRALRVIFQRERPMLKY